MVVHDCCIDYGQPESPRIVVECTSLTIDRPESPRRRVSRPSAVKGGQRLITTLLYLNDVEVRR